MKIIDFDGTGIAVLSDDDGRDTHQMYVIGIVH